MKIGEFLKKISDRVFFFTRIQFLKTFVTPGFDFGLVLFAVVSVAFLLIFWSKSGCSSGSSDF